MQGHFNDGASLSDLEVFVNARSFATMTAEVFNGPLPLTGFGTTETETDSLVGLRPTVGSG